LVAQTSAIFDRSILEGLKREERPAKINLFNSQISSTKIIKSQITKHKYQKNFNDQNSKSQKCLNH
jgi:hypothetical protein